MRWFGRRNRAGQQAERTRQAGRDGATGIGVHLPNPVEAAERFWRRWEDILPTVSAALGDREPHRVENLLCEAVAEIHPDLHFSIERGQFAVYALVLSGQEDPRLRPYTDAWIAAAPPDNTIWEFHDSVPPVPDPTGVAVNLAGHRLALADFRVVAQVDQAEGVVDVAVHHPLLRDLDEASRAAMTFLPLDATLGERLAGERLRRVETAENEPENTITLLELRDLVRELAGPAATSGRRPTFAAEPATEPGGATPGTGPAAAPDDDSAAS